VRALTPRERSGQISAWAIVRSICVYCGFQHGETIRFGEAADQLGSAIAAAGSGLSSAGATPA